MNHKFNPISKKNQTRYPSFFNEDGSPKKVRVYSNLNTKNETADCYTIVMTGNYRNKTDGQFWVLSCSQSPFHPCGVACHEGYDHQIDTPTYSHLGKKISFEKLSQDAKTYVLNTYRYLWDFTDDKEQIL
jgi:hypothetical protein